MNTSNSPQIQKIKINNYQYICTLCSKTYRFESHLRTHFDKDHPKEKYEANHKKILFEPEVKSYPMDKETVNDPPNLEKEWTFQLDPLTKFDAIKPLKTQDKFEDTEGTEWSFKSYDYQKSERKKKKRKKESKIEIKDLIN